MTSLLTRCTSFGTPFRILLKASRHMQPATTTTTTITRTVQTETATSEPAPPTVPSPATTETSNQQESLAAPEPAHIKAIVDQISQLKFFEVNLLSEALKRELKIPDVQRVVAAGPIGATSGASEEEGTAAAVKSSFTVKLVKFEDSKKVALIKEVKKLVEGINLVEAKRFVEDLPKTIKSNASKEEAEALQKQLEGVGAVVKLE